MYVRKGFNWSAELIAPLQPLCEGIYLPTGIVCTCFWRDFQTSVFSWLSKCGDHEDVDPSRKTDIWNSRQHDRTRTWKRRCFVNAKLPPPKRDLEVCLTSSWKSKYSLIRPNLQRLGHLEAKEILGAGISTKREGRREKRFQGKSWAEGGEGGGGY